MMGSMWRNFPTELRCQGFGGAFGWSTCCWPHIGRGKAVGSIKIHWSIRIIWIIWIYLDHLDRISGKQSNPQKYVEIWLNAPRLHLVGEVMPLADVTDVTGGCSSGSARWGFPGFPGHTSHATLGVRAARLRPLQFSALTMAFDILAPWIP